MLLPMNDHAEWWAQYRKPPAFPQARYWQGCGVTLAWNEFGAPDGFPVVYNHGWPSSRWQAQVVDELAKNRGLRILSLDRPGMGDSPWVPGLKIGRWPVWVAAFLDSLGLGAFGQLAVSGGGPFAIACAALLPDRVAATSVLCGAVPLTCASLAGLHPAYRVMTRMRHFPGWIFTPGLGIASAVMKGNPAQAPLRWMARLLPKPDADLLTTFPEVFSSLMTASGEGMKQGGRAVMDHAKIYLDEWSIDLSRIRQPIRCWHGGLDRTVPLSLASEFLKRVPLADLTVMPGDGHFSLAIHQTEAALDALTTRASLFFPTPESSSMLHP
jgi:pimeloyl-ACP methyl ester carboxylesterase